jgi:hypothetical protein
MTPTPTQRNTTDPQSSDLDYLRQKDCRWLAAALRSQHMHHDLLDVAGVGAGRLVTRYDWLGGLSISHAGADGERRVWINSEKEFWSKSEYREM